MATEHVDFIEAGKEYEIRNYSDVPGFAHRGENWHFLGWSLDPYSGIVAYDGIYEPVTMTPNQDVELYAVWAEKYCTVTFDPCGGTYTVPYGTAPFTSSAGYSEVNGKITKRILKGREIGEIPYVTRDNASESTGFVLVGWYDQSLNGTPISRFTRVNENMTVYAQWYADQSSADWKPEHCTISALN